MAAPALSQAYLDEDIGAVATTGTTVSLAIATVFVVLRVYTRIKITKKFGLDDYVLLLSWVLSIVLTFCLWAEVHYGMGRHIEAVTTHEVIQMSKIFFASIIIYGLCAAAVKISILVQYIHIFHLSGVRIACYVVLFIVCGRGISATFATIFSCHPIAYFWDRTISRGACIDDTLLWYCNSGFDITSDVAMIVIPIFPLIKLTMPFKQKLIVALLFVLGGFGALTSILRLSSLSIVLSSADLTWDNTSAATWSSVECNVGAICACLATLRPLASRLFPKLFAFGPFSSLGNTVAGGGKTGGTVTVSEGTMDEATVIGPTRTRGSDSGATMWRRASEAGTVYSVNSVVGVGKKGSVGVGMTPLGEHEEEEEDEDEFMYHRFIMDTGGRSRSGTVESVV